MQTIISVTQEHIDVSERSSAACNTCMVATALKDHFDNVEVGYRTATVGRTGEERKCYMLPEDVTQKIYDFCNGKEVMPFTFSLLPM